MIKTKFVDIPPCWKMFVLGGICVVMSACSVNGTPVTTSTAEHVEQQGELAVEIEDNNASQTDSIGSANHAGHLSVSAGGFLRALLSLNKDSMGGGRFNLQMPAIWVFSPEGNLVRTVQDEQSLEIFKSEFSAIDPQVPNIICQYVEQAVANAANETWNMGCADGKWIALLLVGPTRCGASCMEYKNVLEQTEQTHQDTLQVKTLLVDLRS